MGQPVIHFEVIGKDADRLQGFFSELFGWDIERPMGPMNYGIVQRDGNVNADGAGIGGGIGGGMEGYDGHVTFYVEVPDIEAALAKVTELGGSHVRGPDQVPDGPIIAQYKDPEGHLLGLVQAA